MKRFVLGFVFLLAVSFGFVFAADGDVYWADMNGVEIVEADFGDTVELVATGVSSGSFEIFEEDILADDAIKTIDGVLENGKLVARWTIAQEDLDKTADYDNFKFSVNGDESGELNINEMGDDSPMSIEILSPACGLDFDEGANVEVEVSASDEDDLIDANISVNGFKHSFGNGGVNHGSMAGSFIDTSDADFGMGSFDGTDAGNGGVGLKSSGTKSSLVITADVVNYNIFEEAGSPSSPADVTLTINSGVIVGSLRTGDFPVGSTVTIINNGRIQGRGGYGGNGYHMNNCGNAKGANGGNALELGVSTIIDNRNGQIWGGGGGGGGGSYTSHTSGGNGGGGAGMPGGNGHTSPCWSAYPSTKASAGTAEKGGLHGTCWTSPGGDGGAPGKAGNNACGIGGLAGSSVAINGYSLAFVNNDQGDIKPIPSGYSSGTESSLVIAADIFNYNIFSEAGSPSSPVDVTLTIDSGVVVGSTSASVPALATGNLPSGSSVTIINNGIIIGRGGNGGDGGSSGGPEQDGGDGGIGLSITLPVNINNVNGEINGGGGGGAGSATCSSASCPHRGYGGGGGGAGFGKGGISICSGVGACTPVCGNGVDGTAVSGGAGGGAYGHGGSGGGPGMSGGDVTTNCVPSAPWLQPSGVDGTFGQGGEAIELNGNIITWVGESGNFISRVFDAGDVTAWNSITWNDVVPLDTSLAVYVRASDDNISWSDWSLSYSSSPASLDLSSRYLQYKVEMRTLDTAVSPELLDVVVGYLGDEEIDFSASFVLPGNLQVEVVAVNGRGERSRRISNIMILDKSGADYVEADYVAACITEPEDFSDIDDSIVNFDASTTRAIRVDGAGVLSRIFPGSSLLSWYWEFMPENVVREFVGSDDSIAYIFTAEFPIAGDNSASLRVELV